MTIFYTTLILVFFFSLSSRIFSYKSRYLEYIVIFMSILVVVLVAGLRLNIGDTYAYIQQYNSLGTFNGVLEGKDKGFTIFILILYRISTSPQFMIFVTSLVTQLGNLITLAKYRSYFELETYMYITSGYFLTSMNGIRQSLVAAVMFFFTKYIINGKFLSYLIIVLIMSTIHASALVMIPVYFIVRNEAWSKKTTIIIVIASIGFLFFYQLVPALMDIISNSTYKEYEKDLLTSGGGSSFMRVLVNSVPVVLSYIYRDKIKKIWPESNIFINMSLLNLIIILFATYNWIFARFSIYFELYNFILLPFIIKNCFQKRKERNLVYYLFIICYFIFFYREQVIGGVGLGYKSLYF
ncbi:EpsG family protein [Clostridium perfringens]|nr:EpsG family protein [Clostridium perfringens]